MADVKTASSPASQDALRNKPTSLSYDAITQSLQWQSDVSTGEHTVLYAQDVIALIPPPSSDESVFDLLFVTQKSTTAKPSTLVYQSVKVKHTPSDIVHRFSPSENCLLQRFSPAQKLHVVVSVGSGTGQAKAVFENALQPLLQRLVPERYEVHFTTSADTITELTLSRFLPTANAGHEQVIVLLSGDGGLVDVLNALSSETHSTSYRNPDVALLPLGTGNALANSSGTLNDNTLGLKALVQGHAKQLPAFRASFSAGARYLVDEARATAPLQDVNGTPTAFGCVVCSWGLHAALVADSDTVEYRKFGAERFKMAAKEALFPADGSLPHAYRGKVSFIKADGTDWRAIDRDQHGYVLATLVAQLEAGFTISPASQPLDGVLRLVHFAPLSGKDASDAMGKAYQGGQHIHDERIGYEAVKAFRIEFEEEDVQWRQQTSTLA
ncbi:hypothetical protein AMS68_000725 [Peltaster fructicola]|uniref:DAGKc domain-containing protein n=1 Tax=Peltaster fructicola TaxID=286661 RepID=A0A6H0XKP4_9PEZI|nr:hypothetical protein AMS68_000725 [Peltaster fructicola]